MSTIIGTIRYKHDDNRHTNPSLNGSNSPKSLSQPPLPSSTSSSSRQRRRPQPKPTTPSRFPAPSLLDKRMTDSSRPSPRTPPHRRTPPRRLRPPPPFTNTTTPPSSPPPPHPYGTPTPFLPPLTPPPTNHPPPPPTFHTPPTTYLPSPLRTSLKSTTPSSNVWIEAQRKKRLLENGDRRIPLLESDEVLVARATDIRMEIRRRDRAAYDAERKLMRETRAEERRGGGEREAVSRGKLTIGGGRYVDYLLKSPMMSVVVERGREIVEQSLVGGGSGEEGDGEEEVRRRVMRRRRHIEEVIPSFGELHKNLGYHMRRHGVRLGEEEDGGKEAEEEDEEEEEDKKSHSFFETGSFASLPGFDSVGELQKYAMDGLRSIVGPLTSMERSPQKSPATLPKTALDELATSLPLENQTVDEEDDRTEDEEDEEDEEDDLPPLADVMAHELYSAAAAVAADIKRREEMPHTPLSQRKQKKLQSKLPLGEHYDNPSPPHNSKKKDFSIPPIGESSPKQKDIIINHRTRSEEMGRSFLLSYAMNKLYKKTPESPVPKPTTPDEPPPPTTPPATPHHPTPTPTTTPTPPSPPSSSSRFVAQRHLSPRRSQRRALLLEAPSLLNDESDDGTTAVGPSASEEEERRVVARVAESGGGFLGEEGVTSGEGRERSESVGRGGEERDGDAIPEPLRYAVDSQSDDGSLDDRRGVDIIGDKYESQSVITVEGDKDIRSIERIPSEIIAVDIPLDVMPSQTEHDVLPQDLQLSLSHSQDDINFLIKPSDLSNDGGATLSQTQLLNRHYSQSQDRNGSNVNPNSNPNMANLSQVQAPPTHEISTPITATALPPRVPRSSKTTLNNSFDDDDSLETETGESSILVRSSVVANLLPVLMEHKNVDKNDGTSMHNKLALHHKPPTATPSRPKTPSDALTPPTETLSTDTPPLQPTYPRRLKTCPSNSDISIVSSLSAKTHTESSYLPFPLRPSADSTDYLSPLTTLRQHLSSPHSHTTTPSPPPDDLQFVTNYLYCSEREFGSLVANRPLSDNIPQSYCDMGDLPDVAHLPGCLDLTTCGLDVALDMFGTTAVVADGLGVSLNDGEFERGSQADVSWLKTVVLKLTGDKGSGRGSGVETCVRGQVFRAPTLRKTMENYDWEYQCIEATMSSDNMTILSRECQDVESGERIDRLGMTSAKKAGTPANKSAKRNTVVTKMFKTQERDLTDEQFQLLYECTKEEFFALPVSVRAKRRAEGWERRIILAERGLLGSLDDYHHHDEGRRVRDVESDAGKNNTLALADVLTMAII